MYPTTLIVIFAISITITVSINTLMIWLAYKGFASVTRKATEAVHEFAADSATREWITSLERVASQAASVTEATKRKMQENSPILEDLQTRFEYTLAKIDVRVERVTEAVTEKTSRVCDAVIKPAEKIGAIADGLHDALGCLSPSNEDAQAS